MNVSDVADQIGTRLESISGLRVYVGPPRSISVPAAVIAMPENIAFDATYGRGADRATWPILVLVGQPSDRTAMERLGAYCDGSGTASIKAVLESGDSYTAFHTIRVTKVDFDVVNWQGTDFAAALFEVDVFGSGSS